MTISDWEPGGWPAGEHSTDEQTASGGGEADDAAGATDGAATADRPEAVFGSGFSGAADDTSEDVNARDAPVTAVLSEVLVAPASVTTPAFVPPTAAAQAAAAAAAAFTAGHAVAVDQPVFDEQGREILTWERFGQAARELARAVLDTGFDPEVVVAIARGGLTLAGAIAYALDVKACGTLNVEFYAGFEETLPEPVVLPPFLDASAFEGKRVLLVDDVSDSGRTLDLVSRLLRDDFHVTLRTVCLYTKPRTISVPDVYWRSTSNWIAFPWSAEHPVGAPDDDTMEWDG